MVCASRLGATATLLHGIILVKQVLNDHAQGRILDRKPPLREARENVNVLACLPLFPMIKAVAKAAARSLGCLSVKEGTIKERRERPLDWSRGGSCGGGVRRGDWEQGRMD